MKEVSIRNELFLWKLHLEIWIEKWTKVKKIRKSIIVDIFNRITCSIPTLDWHATGPYINEELTKMSSNVVREMETWYEMERRLTLTNWYQKNSTMPHMYPIMATEAYPNVQQPSSFRGTNLDIFVTWRGGAWGNLRCIRGLWGLMTGNGTVGTPVGLVEQPGGVGGNQDLNWVC